MKEREKEKRRRKEREKEKEETEEEKGEREEQKKKETVVVAPLLTVGLLPLPTVTAALELLQQPGSCDHTPIGNATLAGDGNVSFL